jgi:hypothetical protein
MVQEDILDYQESVMQLVSGMKRGGDVMPARNKKNFRPTEKGAGMTRAGVQAYREQIQDQNYPQQLQVKLNQEAEQLREENLFVPDLPVR